MKINRSNNIIATCYTSQRMSVNMSFLIIIQLKPNKPSHVKIYELNKSYFSENDPETHIIDLNTFFNIKDLIVELEISQKQCISNFANNLQLYKCDKSFDFILALNDVMDYTIEYITTIGLSKLI